MSLDLPWLVCMHPIYFSDARLIETPAITTMPTVGKTKDTSQTDLANAPAPRARSFIMAAFTASFFFSLWFVIARGAFTSDLGGDPDEAAHAVTGLMVRDYLAQGLMHSPMKFASEYYANFPKVALGHYPPGYYVLSAPLLLACPSVKVFFILQALLLATLTTLVTQQLIKIVSPSLAVMAGLCVTMLPLSLKQCQVAMSDLLLAVVCFIAAIFWGRYLQFPSLKRSLIWGCIASAAILIKGSAIGLCLMPPVATLFARRWKLFGTLSWWSSAVPVALLAGPWMIYSTHISKEGMTEMSPLAYLQEAVPFYLHAMPHVFGWPVLVLATWGILSGARAFLKTRAFSPAGSAMISLAVGMGAVLLVVPVGLTSRYMLTLAPLMVMAAAYGLQKIMLPGFLEKKWSKPLILCAISFQPLINGSLPEKKVLGYTTAVHRSIQLVANSQSARWLVASDPRGEGAVIAAAAFGSQQRFPANLRVYRGSKELATSDWMGRGYKAAFTTEADLLDHLDNLHVTRVFLDLSVPQDRQLAHELQLLNAMQSGNQRWQLDFEQPITRAPGETGMLRVYQRTSSNSPN